MYIFSHNYIDSIAIITLELSKQWISSLNATMKIDIQRTQGYKNLTTGQITGAVGKLQRKEADISGNQTKF